jgi:hypothetical protein
MRRQHGGLRAQATGDRFTWNAWGLVIEGPSYRARRAPGNLVGGEASLRVRAVGNPPGHAVTRMDRNPIHQETENPMIRTVAALALVTAAAFARPAPASVPDLTVRPIASDLDLRLQLGSGGDAPAAKETTLFGLPKNVGPVDRVLRLAVAATLVGVGTYRLSNDSPNRGLSWALVGVAAVPAATGAVGYCPLYQLLGIDNTF